jgi:hypothetical protein
MMWLIYHVQDASVLVDSAAVAAGVEDKKVVFNLRRTDPRSVALEAEAMRVARLNRDLMARIKTLGSWVDAQVGMCLRGN